MISGSSVEESGDGFERIVEMPSGVMDFAIVFFSKKSVEHTSL